MIESEKISALFVQKGGANVGIAIFHGNRRIQCSQIHNLCVPFYKNLSSIFQEGLLICNNLQHDFFRWDHIKRRMKVIQVTQKEFEYEAIEHNICRLFADNIRISNKKAYISRMANFKLKFNALGLLLYYLYGQTLLLKGYQLNIEHIDYFIDSLLFRVQHGNRELQFLQIIREDIHPSMIKGKGASKEGYCIYSAYEGYLFSAGSKRVLRYLFTNPTFQVSILNERLDLIEWIREFMKQDQVYSKWFRKIHVLQSILKKCDKLIAEEEDWRKMIKTLSMIVQIRNMLAAIEGPYPSLIQQFIDDEEGWKQINHLLYVANETLDFYPFTIKSGIDRDLDELRQTYDNMPHLLTIYAKEQRLDFKYRIIFMTQVGYLIKVDPLLNIDNLIDQNQWTLQFANQTGQYYSNKLTQKLDTQYGDIYGEIQDIQKKILLSLEAIIVKKAQIFLRVYWKCCEIECFWGISIVSRGMCRPRMSSENMIVSNSWHFLLKGQAIHNHCFSFPQSKAETQKVYNSEQNIINTNYSNRCVILSGPNGSGKTIYLKQMGLLIFLAHLGIFVPASFAQLPLIDAFVFIGRSQSIFCGQSTGLVGELKSLSQVASPWGISNKAFVMIDELGGEANYQVALQLLYTTIYHLSREKRTYLHNSYLSRQQDEFKHPFVVIITHLTELMNLGLVQQSYNVRFMTMAVDNKKKQLNLYKIMPGLVRGDYGISAAQEIMDQDIIEASRWYLKQIRMMY